MNKKKKVVLGLLSFSYLILFGTFMSCFHIFGEDFVSSAKFLIPFFIIASSVIISMVYYPTHVSRNQKFDTVDKVIWYVLFYLFLPISLPIYWFRHIQKANDEDIDLLATNSITKTTMSSEEINERV